jgi:ribosomal protein S18 acetylase RimI-like enzyme
MSSPDTLIRRLEPGDAAAMRALRLESLAAFPSAFATDTAEDDARPVEAFAAMLSDPEELAVYGGFVGGELVGMAGFAREAKAKMRHKGLLWGVYVRPACHGLGLGRALVEAVIAHARGRVALLHACVSPTNDSARRTYFGLGFQSWGVERRALLVDGEWCDDDHIVLELV